jgi:hypothetical protein
MRLLIAFLFSSTITFSGEVHNDHASKLEMIIKLKTFISKEVGMSIPEDFYSTWEDGVVTNYILYTSSKHEVKSVISRPFQYFGKDETAAIQAKKKQDSLGYETMLYETKNTVSTKLSSSLLDFPKESIVFIIIHEATHAHLKNKKVPYIIEEATCEVIANLASMDFFKQYNEAEFSKAKKQQKLNEKLVKKINESQKLADLTLFEHKQKLFTTTDKKIKNIVKRGNELHKDRFNYDVNNAFYIRYQNYTKNYFILKQELQSLKSYSKFLSTVENMTEKSPKIIDTIKP